MIHSTSLIRPSIGKSSRLLNLVAYKIDGGLALFLNLTLALMDESTADKHVPIIAEFILVTMLSNCIIQMSVFADQFCIEIFIYSYVL